MLRTVTATRYVTPLREGGSLPAIVEADDDGTYVLKFRGAGQGPKALIAELIGGEIARALGLPVPEIVLVELDPALGRTEPDDEIRALLKASAGLNLALDYLPGALAFDPLHPTGLDAKLASRIVWLDAFITNVDRTPRNTNLLQWHRQLWLIDHGASLIIQHDWTGDLAERSRTPFRPIRDHVLLPWASAIAEEAPALLAALPPDRLESILALIPAPWLEGDARFPDATDHRRAFHNYLTGRLTASDIFIEEAVRARAQRV